MANKRQRGERERAKSLSFSTDFDLFLSLFCFLLLSLSLFLSQVMIGDGQVTQGSVVIKPNVQKVRRIGTNILVGFAGSTADAFTL